jgi:hypothetical protein
MAEPLVVNAGERGVDELIDAIKERTHVVVRTEFLGSEHEVTLRWDGDTFYCDTPTKLHKHDDESEMRACLRNQGYGHA